MPNQNLRQVLAEMLGALLTSALAVCADGAYCQISYLDTMLAYMATHGGPTLALLTAPYTGL